MQGLRIKPRDGITWRAFARVEKYSARQVEYARRLSGLAEPAAAELRELCGWPEDGAVEAYGNLLVTAGLNQITNLITGGGDNPFSHANAIVGVGAGTTAAAVGDTALTDDNTSSAWYQQADSSYPTASDGVITCESTFGSGAANFAWQEWCWAFGGGGAITAGDHLSAVTSTPPVMINHKVQSLGTKSSGSWVFTATVTLS